MHITITIEYMNLNAFLIVYVNVSKTTKQTCRNVKLYCGAVIATIINKQ